jgi:predicted TIM-barrel fold metal-dependent hydrolase
MTFRLWDLFENIALWSSDMPHLDASDVWEAIDHMNKWKVPQEVQEKMLGGNARRLYGIEPRLIVTQAPDEYEPVTMSRYA